MFIEALFTIARHGNNLCPLTDEWIKQDVTHTHSHTQSGILLSHEKE